MVNEAKLSAVLCELAQTLLSDIPVRGILDHLVERTVELLPVTAAGMSLVEPAGPSAVTAASNEVALRCERLQAELGEGPGPAAVHRGEAVSVPDLGAGADRFGRAAAEAGIAAAFAVPLRHGGRRMGALVLYRDTPGMLEPRDLEVAQTLADVAGAYITNARARAEVELAVERLQHLALHDQLTGLPNRLLLRERLAHATHRAQRSHADAAVLFVDLDRFKQVNDTYGHQVGDELLRAVGHRLAGLVRPGDTLSRVSGDEFVFLCEDIVGPDDVEVLATRIAGAFAEPFTLGSTTHRLSASVGVAFAGPGESISDDLVAMADAAMYRAKRNGGAEHHIFDLRDAVDEPSGERRLSA